MAKFYYNNPITSHVKKNERCRVTYSQFYNSRCARLWNTFLVM